MNGNLRLHPFIFASLSTQPFSWISRYLKVQKHVSKQYGYYNSLASIVLCWLLVLSKTRHKSANLVCILLKWELHYKLMSYFLLLNAMKIISRVISPFFIYNISFLIGKNGDVISFRGSKMNFFSWFFLNFWLGISLSQLGKKEVFCHWEWAEFLPQNGLKRNTAIYGRGSHLGHVTKHHFHGFSFPCTWKRTYEIWLKMAQ